MDIKKLLSVFALGFVVCNGAWSEPKRLLVSQPILSRPHDMVLSPDHSKLYVADLGKDRVAVLDANTLELLGEFGNGELRAPHDVAFDASGRLLVADTDHNRIAVYAVEGVNGRLVDQVTGDLNSPDGVAVLSDGRMAATDTGGGALVIFSGKQPTGRVARADGLRFRRPHDVLVLPDDNILLTDSGNDRLILLTASLEVVRVIGGPNYGFRGPRYTARALDGTLYVADKDAHRVLMLDQSFNLIGQIGTGTAGAGVGQIHRPEGVEALGDRVWIADTYNDRIVLYRR